MAAACVAPRMTRRRSSGLIQMDGKDDALDIFAKYQLSFARRLHKPEALTMLMTEFRLSESEADVMFQTFDKDGNSVLSLWEFRQFFQTIGHNAHSIMELFRRLEIPGTGNIDIEAAFDAMRGVESGKGKLDDEEIAYFLKTTAGDAKEIGLQKFINMMCRLKVYRGN